MLSRFRILLGLGLALAAVLWLAGAAFGHGGEEGAASLTLEPASTAPGSTVLVVGTELAPEAEMLLQLTGEGLTIRFGEATTNAEGRLTQELEVPAHVPAGVYQVEAIADETVIAELQLIGSGEGAVLATDAEGSAAGRERGVLGYGIVVVVALLAAIAGLILVVRSDRFADALA